MKVFRLVLAVLFLTCAGTGTARAANKAEAIGYWGAHAPTSTAQIDHSDWDRFLRTYVVKRSPGYDTVNYAAVTAADRAALNTYVKALEATRITSHNRAEQLAYWINLYNALTVRVVLEHFPVDSIKDIKYTVNPFVQGPWSEPLLTIEGQRVSLDDIEHGILRPYWKDPRLHYVLNCASVGCPDVGNQAFSATDSDSRLDQAAIDYVNDPRGIDILYGLVHVSSIYDWYQVDFGDSESAVLEHIRRYATPALAERIAGITEIDEYRYDWALNGPNKRKRRTATGSYSR